MKQDATILDGAPEPPSKNGRKQVLLWLNTSLTLLIFPLFGWAARELWTKVDTNGGTLIRVEERQAEVRTTLPVLQSEITKLTEKVDAGAEKLHEADLHTLERLDNLEKAVLELKYNVNGHQKP